VTDFQELYEKYNKDIYYFILRFTNYNNNLAEELTQETFYQTYISLYRYKGGCDIKTWICQIAKNVCYKYFRKNPFYININDASLYENVIADGSKSAQELIEMQETSEIIYNAIRKLKTKYKDVLIYRLYFEFSFKQIGNVMHISENSTKVIYHRGKEMLKQKLKGV